MDWLRLVEVLHREQAQSETIPIIIAHGGYLHDFPILLASCMKHNCDKFGILTECMFVEVCKFFRMVTKENV